LFIFVLTKLDFIQICVKKENNKKMFRENYQKGCFSVFNSLGSSPLSIWGSRTQNGYIKRLLDEDCRSVTLEIIGTNVSTCYIYAPREEKVALGIKMPFLILLIKNLHKYFTFEVKILDDQNFCRRFRVSNFHSKTSVKPFCTQMPMGMSEGWNQIHFNLADFTRRAYGTTYIETVSLQIHANIRIRRIYFTDRLYTEDELPNDYRLISRPKEKKKFMDYKVPSARPPSPQSVKSKKTEGKRDEGETMDSPDGGGAPTETDADEGPTEPPKTDDEGAGAGAGDEDEAAYF